MPGAYYLKQVTNKQLQHKQVSEVNSFTQGKSNLIILTRNDQTKFKLIHNFLITPLFSILL